MTVCGLGLALGADTPAVAQETPGYHPDDPAGVEYQLPLQRTRREAAGRKPDDRKGRANKPIPLFGAGPRANKERAKGGSSRSEPPRQGSDQAATVEGTSARRAGASDNSGASTLRQAPRSTAAASSTEDDNPLQLGLIGGILMVILGAVTGIAVRMRSRRGDAAA